MSLTKNNLEKKISVSAGLVAFAAAVLISQNVYADSGPVITNLNPQGLVTTQNVKITLDTEDLAKCRYSTGDASYDSMNNNFDTLDGLYHSASLGSLNKGSYTYYIRCKDFEGNSNGSSVTAKFNVGEVSCVGDNCGTTNPPAGGAGPVLSGLLPSGTLYNGTVVLSVTTNEAAECRYSWYDKAFDAMTLPFATSDRLYHSASASLSNYGYYTYYVRCRNTAGNVNQVTGRISFRYATKVTTPVVPVTPADKTAPVISSLVPSGDVNTANVTISCTTDEAAICKYGTTDGEFDSLADTMDTAGGMTHNKGVALTAAGKYTYYVRCKDAKGNKNTVSSQIGFNYIAAAKAGPVISDLRPAGGAVYQKNVGLIITTDKPADCRYSDKDVDFDAMQETFSTSDGSLYQATVTLDSFGSYAYYVRCKDKEGNKNDKSEVINFEYKENPDSEETVDNSKTNNTADAGVTCAEVRAGEKDGACDPTNDCICDPDCPASGDDADSDCANAVTTAAPAQNNAWVAVVIIGLLLLAIAVVVIIIIKKRSGDEEDVELP